MRERTTWDRNVIAKRAGQKKAEDPRAMNQDHLKMQPPMDKYVTGGPSEFAEDVSPSEGSWKSEYSDGSTDRNEIGAPEMRKDTFSHAEKTASDEVRLTKKANLCVEIAKKVLGKTASEQTIEDQAVAFMHIPDQDLIQTATRLAAEEEDEKEEADEEDDSKEEQKKQAADDQSSDDDEEEEKGQDKGQEQSKKQAQQQMQSQQQMQQLAQKALQAIDANDQQQAKQAIQQMVQQAYTFAQQQPGKQAQQQDVQSQVQQMIQEAMQQCQGQQQQQQAPVAQQDQMQAQQTQQSQDQQQMQQQSQQQQMSNDDQLLDQMMMDEMGPQDQGQMVMASDIELEGAYMDLGEASGDDALRALFASGTEYQEAVQAAAITQGKGPQTKTARVLGTKPKGVSQLGGVGSSAANAAPSEVNRLTALWKSAPDVSTVFNGS